jgi:hypothetical protein
MDKERDSKPSPTKLLLFCAYVIQHAMSQMQDTCFAVDRAVLLDNLLRTDLRLHSYLQHVLRQAFHLYQNDSRAHRSLKRQD